MNHPKFIGWAALVGSLCLVSGCAERGGLFGVDRWADIPAGAVPRPAGTAVCDWQAAQVDSAIVDQSVLYRADFVGTTARLAPSARQRMSRHAQSQLGSVLPWCVEPSGNPELDAARVASVIAELSARGIEASEVRVATPAALGLSGLQAERTVAATADTEIR